MLKPVKIKDLTSGEEIVFQMWENHCSFQMADRIVNVNIEQLNNAIIETRKVLDEYITDKLEREEAERISLEEAEKIRKASEQTLKVVKTSKTTENENTGKGKGSKSKDK